MARRDWKKALQDVIDALGDRVREAVDALGDALRPQELAPVPVPVDGRRRPQPPR